MPRHDHPVLLDLIRAEPGHVSLPALPQGPDEWDALLAATDAQKLVPLLRDRLEAAGALARLPSPRQEWLWTATVRTAAQNAILAEELRVILRRLHDRGIACAVVRGFALVEEVHGRDLPRPMGDIDLLVRRQSLGQTADTLTGLGFAEVRRPTSASDGAEYSLTFTKTRYGTILVEPHWTIAYPPFANSVDMAAVWARTGPGQVLGVDVRHLDPHDLVLHLCLHLVHWRESAPLLWFHEIDRLIRRDEPKIDWFTVLARARSSGQGAFVIEAARALRDVCWTSIPEAWSTATGDEPDPDAAGGWVGGAMRRRALGLLVRESKARGREEFATLLSLHGFRARLRYARGLLYPPSDYMRFRYGPCGPLRLAWRYVARTWKLSGEAVRWLRALLAPVSTR